MRHDGLVAAGVLANDDSESLIHLPVQVLVANDERAPCVVVVLKEAEA